MSLAPELLKIICCPETHQSLRLLGKDEVSKLNGFIQQQSLSYQNGEVVSQPVDGGLLREDGKRVYPVKSDIPILLIEEGIVLNELLF